MRVRRLLLPLLIILIALVPAVYVAAPYARAADYGKAAPAQPIEPWVTALARLLDDEAHYAEISEASRRAARAFVTAQHARSLADARRR